MSRTERFKVVLLGEGRVGKTSILLRYIKGEYDDRQISTLQASYLENNISVDGTDVKLSVWDTAGQERFHALGPIYYRDADAALLVYDITDGESFTKVRTWVKELRKIVGNNIAINIAGNKFDLQKNRNVDLAEAEAYAASVNATHWHTSAKKNIGIDECFLELTQKIIKQKATSGRGSRKGKLLVEDDSKPARGRKNGKIDIVSDHEAANKGGCC